MCRSKRTAGGGTLRKRFEAVDADWLYDVFFATHSNHVHGSWYELRTFHLQTTDGVCLDRTFAALAPPVMYETARMALAAIVDYLDGVPVGGLVEDIRTVAMRTIEVSPVGSALLGRRVGDVIEVEVPGGLLRIEILEIQI